MRTIWNPAVLRKVPPEWRFQVLYVFPVVYGVNAVSYLLFGAIGGGSKVMRAALGPWGAQLLSGGLGLAAAAALIGLALQRHQLERWASLSMVALSLAYLVLLFFALGTGGNPSGALAGTGLTIGLTIPRVRQVARDIGRKRAKK